MALSKTQITDLNRNSPRGIYFFLLTVNKINYLTGSSQTIGRFTDDNVKKVIRGRTYIALPFKVSFPSSGDEKPGILDLTMPLYDPTFVNVVREAAPGVISQARIEFNFEMFSHLDLNNNVGGKFKMFFLGASFNPENIVFSVGYENLVDISYPFHEYNKGDYPLNSK